MARMISMEVLDNLLMWEKEYYLEDFVSCIKANMMTDSSNVMPVLKEASRIESREKVDDIKIKR